MKKTFKDTLCNFLNMHHTTFSGHIGGGLSVLPLIYNLFDGFFNPETDFIVFSKGHSVAALYATLNAADHVSDELLATYHQDGTKLGAHTPANLVNFVPFATGSLGHGFSLANGLALAKRFKKEQGSIFCFCGDGEWQEGSCWEALNFSVNHRLNNITVIVDCNNWQGFGSVMETTGVECEGLANRITSFGVNAHFCDGENFEEIANAYAAKPNNKPKFIFAKTTKGKGLLEYEDTLDCHYIQLNNALYQRVINKMVKEK